MVVSPWKPAKDGPEQELFTVCFVLILACLISDFSEGNILLAVFLILFENYS